MEYLRLSADGLTIYTEWLLKNGEHIKVDLDREDYFEYIEKLRADDKQVEPLVKE